jgi:hypothetical protein
MKGRVAARMIDFGLRLVTDIKLTRPPTWVSSRGSEGWRNLIVHVSDGGIEAHESGLQFDGSTYPSNPTVPPAEPAADLDGSEIIIPEFGTPTDGTSLFSQ